MRPLLTALACAASLSTASLPARGASCDGFGWLILFE